MTSLALVVGAGSGLSAAIARALAQRSYRPILVARDTGKLDALRAEVDGVVLQCDASVPDAVAELFRTIDGMDGSLDVAVYNASSWVRGQSPNSIRSKYVQCLRSPRSGRSSWPSTLPRGC